MSSVIHIDNRFLRPKVQHEKDPKFTGRFCDEIREIHGQVYTHMDIRIGSANYF